MSIRLILGRSGVGKTRHILSEIKEKCDTQSQGHPIFVIIPDQMAFHTEYQLLKQSKHPSLMRVQGLSFNRFAYRILQETGGLSRHHLDEVGIAILLQKIMHENKNDLKLFSSYIKKPGFTQKISEIISEFKSYCVNPEQLALLLKEQGNQSAWSNQSTRKLNDIALLYQNFTQTSLKKYLMSEDYFTLLSEQIAMSQTIANSEFYIDGYHLFNKQEELIILQLMKFAKSVTVVLTHDLQSSSQVFDLPKRTYSQLITNIKSMGLNYEVKEILEDEVSRFSKKNAIAHLEKNFLQHPQEESEASGISFFSAVNQRIEVEEVAKRIYHLVHKEGYTYSDIAIYTADADLYNEKIASIFGNYDIPYFLDHKEPMLYHPLINLLYHIFEVILNGWRHEAMFTVIKTGLFIDINFNKNQDSFYSYFQKHQREIDILENYCLTRNIRKKDWQSKDSWDYSRYKGLNREASQIKEDKNKENLERLRHIIAKEITKFETGLKKAETYKDYAIETFKFLENLEIPQKLKFLEETSLELNEMQKLKQNEQVWNQLLSLFEQLVEIGQDEDVLLEDFVTIFKSGLEEMNYLTVPPRLDQVSIGELRRSRYQLVNDLKQNEQFGIKHAFVLGVNEGQIPKNQTESSLINETEREQLKEIGIDLAPSLEQSQVDEQFILYTVFISPKETLTLSYTSSNDEGKEFLPSYIYTHVKKLFPKAIEEHIGRDWNSNIYENITTVTKSLAHVIHVLKESPEKEAYFKPLLDYYEEKYPLKYQLIQQILNYKNQAVSLDTNVTKALYTEEIVASVSRIELFNQCEFAHFARYGLRLKERELYRLDLPHIGELYHEALKRIAQHIHKEGKSFANLTEEECLDLANMTSDELSQQLLFQILKRNKRMINLTKRLTQVIYKTLIGLKYQSEKSNFDPMFFELPFDTQATSGIHLEPKPLNNGFTLALKGIVDRIDVAKFEDRAYVRVIDYKSSQKQLKLDAVYYGLSLQLLTYLDVVVSNAFQLLNFPAEVGGMLYFHVHRPFINYDEELLQKEEPLEIIEELQQEKYKMTGFLPDDYDVVKLSDQRLGEEKNKSDIVPITLKKDGSFSSVGNSILSEEKLNLVRNFTNKKIKDSAIKITQGSLEINPSQYGQVRACTYCEFRSVCQIDTDLPENNFRTLNQMKNDLAINAMNSEFEAEVIVLEKGSKVNLNKEEEMR